MLVVIGRQWVDIRNAAGIAPARRSRGLRAAGGRGRARPRRAGRAGAGAGRAAAARGGAADAARAAGDAADRDARSRRVPRRRRAAVRSPGAAHRWRPRRGGRCLCPSRSRPAWSCWRPSWAAMPGIAARRPNGSGWPPTASARLERTRQVAALVETATGQRQRRQFGDAVKTLEAARQLDSEAAEPRLLLEDVAMQWLREVQGDETSKTFGEALKPALAIVDRALPGSSGSRRADLLAHQGWATFLLWRDGDRSLRPQDRYREALAIDADNPYANAMLAHWTLWTGDDVDEAARLFGAALQGQSCRGGRANAAVGGIPERLQRPGAGGDHTPGGCDAARQREADAPAIADDVGDLLLRAARPPGCHASAAPACGLARRSPGDAAVGVRRVHGRRPLAPPDHQVLHGAARRRGGPAGRRRGRISPHFVPSLPPRRARSWMPSQAALTRMR